MENHKQNHNQLWSYHNFPNQSQEDEDILLIVREDISKVTDRLAIGFYTLVGVLLLRSVSVNGFGNLTMVYLADTIMYGFLCYLMLKIAYCFHNYFLSFYAITKYRIIGYEQQNLVSGELFQIWFKDIQKIEIPQPEDSQKVSTHTQDIIIYLKKENSSVVILKNIPKTNEILSFLQGFVGHNYYK